MPAPDTREGLGARTLAGLCRALGAGLPGRGLLPPGLKDRVRAWLLRPAHRRLWRERASVADSLARHPAGVNLFGVLDEPDGIGEGGRSTERALGAAGLPFARVAVSEAELHGAPLAPDRAAGAAYAANVWQLTPGHDPLLVMALGPGSFLGRFNVGYWAWELESFPRDWDDSYRYFGEIWTPSAFSRKALAERSPVPVEVVPHCVEVRLSERDWRGRFGLPPSRAALLCMFDMASVAERKNPLGAVRAFRLAVAGRRDAPLLVVKTRRPEANPAAWRELRAALEGLDARIVTENLSREESWGLVSACDALVSLHRAEGFGLVLAEAMALGKPVVATGYSGNMDFMTEENSLPVRFRLTEIGRRSGPYPRGYRWAEPDIDHAASRIREVLDGPERAREIGRRAARDVEERLSPAAVGGIVRARLEALGFRFDSAGENHHA